MPRRYPDYPAAFAGWNFVSSLGAYISGAAFLVFLYVCYRTFTSKEHVAGQLLGCRCDNAGVDADLAPPRSIHILELAADLLNDLG